MIFTHLFPPCLSYSNGHLNCVPQPLSRELNFATMPTSKPKPSEVASEAKRKYLPWLEKNFPDLSPRCTVHTQPTAVQDAFRTGRGPKKLRVAVIAGDAVDVALDWNESQNNGQSSMSKSSSGSKRVLLVLPADEQRSGGDWESGAVAPEENLARRSNLVGCLKKQSSNTPSYPIPVKGGLYSPKVGKLSHPKIKVPLIPDPVLTFA